MQNSLFLLCFLQFGAASSQRYHGGITASSQHDHARSADREIPEMARWGSTQRCMHRWVRQVCRTHRCIHRCVLPRLAISGISRAAERAWSCCDDDVIPPWCRCDEAAPNCKKHSKYTQFCIFYLSKLEKNTVNISYFALLSSPNCKKHSKYKLFFTFAVIMLRWCCDNDVIMLW